MAPTGHRVDGMKIARARMSIVDRDTGQALKQAAFAKRLGIHPVTMSNIENGKANVSLDLLEKIAAETGTRRDDLLASSEDDEEAAQAMARRGMLEDLHWALGVVLGKDQVHA